MKKVYIFTGFILSLFFNMNVINAESSISCTKKVIENDNIECTVTVDGDGVTVMSDGNINILDLTGERYSKLNSNKALFYESGTIIFGPASNNFSSYTIFLYNADGKQEYAPSINVDVIPKTTTKKTTTTTKKKSSNNYLTSISVNDESVANFKKTTTRYYLSVPYEVEKADIKITREDELSKTEINGPDFLEVGANEFTISVTSEDNTTRFYKLLITRLAKEKEASSNTKLKSIVIEDYDLAFDNSSKTFHLKINENTNKLSMKVKLDDDKASYKILNNENLTDESVVSIVVTAENGKTDTYRIIINKEKKENLKPIILSISLIVIIIIIIVVLYIFRRKKRNKNIKIKDELEKTIVVTDKSETSSTDYSLEKTIKMDNINIEEKEEKNN